MIPGTLGIIPARLRSARLPRKPLTDIAGRPLIEWVWRRVAGSRLFEHLVVATDSEEVAAVVRAVGGEAVLTDVGHVSGTDRVAEVARLPTFRDYPYLVNVQGDEPFVRDGDIAAAARLVAEEGWQIGTVAAPIADRDEWMDPSVVKCVRGANGQALYFSRAAVPHPRDGLESGDLGARTIFLRHVGLYAYTRDALLEWVSLPEGDLERIERLEQLRPLAAGMRIGVALVPPGEGGVDTPADAARAELQLREQAGSRFAAGISTDL
jgi:3-deoxy-D-manno-octulosonate cytidylyltransferase